MVTLRDSEDVTPKTLWERNIHDIVAYIREKDSWWENYTDSTILEEWKSEVGELVKAGNFSPQFMFLREELDRTFEAVRRRLDYFNVLRQKQFPWIAGYSKDIYYADDIVEHHNKAKLRELTAKLEEELLPKERTTVVDLVDPSLYPIEIGVTQLKSGKTLSRKKVRNSGFQWIPALFTVKGDCDCGECKVDVSIDSYINDLYPERYGEYYPIIAAVFGRALPGLTRVLDNAQLPSETLSPEYTLYCPYYEHNEFLYDLLEPNTIPPVIGYDLQHEYERRLRKWKSGGLPFNWDRWMELNIPSPSPTKYELHTYLKVIVKLESINLTPDSPVYGGSAWHLEGSTLENIVSTVLYFYDSENITASKLSFRGAVKKYHRYPEMKTDHQVEMYLDVNMHATGAHDFSYVEPAGNVNCLEDRLLVFPNLFQKQAGSFELADKSRPGHQKVLAFYVCNPDNESVIASDQVPYQQKEWLADVVSEALDHKLPPELTHMVLSNCPAMTRKQAEERRKRLVEKRSGQ